MGRFLTLTTFVLSVALQLGNSKQAPEIPNFDLVKKDIAQLLTNSQEFWPADFGNYGPLFIRLAWHCAGSYRISDGRGGCDGGRIRHNPERSWDDNTNLDKALRLLSPIKIKHGAELSWGDLVILAGTTAIEEMGGPVLGFCGGRTDDPNGDNSLVLGPTPEQEILSPCKENGRCKHPIGTNTLGLIYVNPAGPMGVPNPHGSSIDIRDVFSRMGMNDRETVALIGGGHAFGKTHGACPTGPGENPLQCPQNPWAGTCGNGTDMGKGNNTFTSGFEVTWTSTPTSWSNSFFKNLLQYQWNTETSPGGNVQWAPSNVKDVKVRMLTSDVALINDPEYKKLVEEYADNITSLEYDFSHAWYKLTTGDMGPFHRCFGNNVPPPQAFQDPLPPPPDTTPVFSNVKEAIKNLLHTHHPAIEPDISMDGTPTYGPLFVNLGFQCFSTYRDSDHKGGCNGAKIRFSPQKDWNENLGMDKVMEVLKSVKDTFQDLTWADLIILSGQIAIEEGDTINLGNFEFLRSDGLNGDGDEKLAPRDYYPEGPMHHILAARDTMKIMGLEPKDFVALKGRPRSLTQAKRLGFTGIYSDVKDGLHNDYFKILLTETWESINDGKEYKAKGKEIYMRPSDLVLIWDSEFKSIVEEYATDGVIFKEYFNKAWNYIVKAELSGL